MPQSLGEYSQAVDAHYVRCSLALELATRV